MICIKTLHSSVGLCIFPFTFPHRRRLRGHSLSGCLFSSCPHMWNTLGMTHNPPTKHPPLFLVVTLTDVCGFLCVRMSECVCVCFDGVFWVWLFASSDSVHSIEVQKEYPAHSFVVIFRRWIYHSSCCWKTKLWWSPWLPWFCTYI